MCICIPRIRLKGESASGDIVLIVCACVRVRVVYVGGLCVCVVRIPAGKVSRRRNERLRGSRTAVIDHLL